MGLDYRPIVDFQGVLFKYETDFTFLALLPVSAGDEAKAKKEETLPKKAECATKNAKKEPEKKATCNSCGCAEFPECEDEQGDACDDCISSNGNHKVLDRSGHPIVF